MWNFLQESNVIFSFFLWFEFNSYARAHCTHLFVSRWRLHKDKIGLVLNPLQSLAASLTAKNTGVVHFCFN